MGLFSKTVQAKASAAPQGISQSFGNAMMAIAGLGRPRWTQRNYPAQLEEAYRRNVVARRCVALVAEAAAAIPLTLYDARGKIVTKHPLLDLLARPNPQSSGGAFLVGLYTTFQLAGNVYVEAVRPEADAAPTELYQLRPDRMAVLPGPGGLPSGYEYQLNGQKHVWPCDPLTGAADVLHWKNFNPTDDWYGAAPLESALMSIDQHNAAGNWNQALLGNAARPSGALVYNPKDGSPANLTAEQMSRLRDEFDSYHTGARAAGRPLILEGGLEWRSMAMSPQEMEWLAGRDAAARDIALAFGVPAQLIGITAAQSYSNMVEARLALYEETVLPLTLQLLNALNSWLLPMLDDRVLRLELDADEISALVPRREAVWKKVEGASFLTVNEKRQALGYPPLDAGDRLSAS